MKNSNVQNSENNFKEVFKITTIDNLLNVINTQIFADFMQSYYQFSLLAKEKPDYNIFLHCVETNTEGIETFKDKIIQYDHKTKKVY